MYQIDAWYNYVHIYEFGCIDMHIIIISTPPFFSRMRLHRSSASSASSKTPYCMIWSRHVYHDLISFNKYTIRIHDVTYHLLIRTIITIIMSYQWCKISRIHSTTLRWVWGVLSSLAVWILCRSEAPKCCREFAGWPGHWVRSHLAPVPPFEKNLNIPQGILGKWCFFLHVQQKHQEWWWLS